MKFFKKTDLIIILILVAVGAGGLAFYYLRPAGDNLTAEIYYENDIIAKVSLEEGAKSFSLPGHENVIFNLDGNGSIAFEQSDCPDQICVHAGKLSKAGQSAACLPNKLIVRVVSPNGGNVDYIV